MRFEPFWNPNIIPGFVFMVCATSMVGMMRLASLTACSKLATSKVEGCCSTILRHSIDDAVVRGRYYWLEQKALARADTNMMLASIQINMLCLIDPATIFSKLARLSPLPDIYSAAAPAAGM